MNRASKRASLPLDRASLPLDHVLRLYPLGQVLQADLCRTVISASTVIDRAAQQRKRVVRVDRLAATNVVGVPPGCSVCAREWPWQQARSQATLWSAAHTNRAWLCRDCRGFLCAGCVYPHTPRRCEALCVIKALAAT